jgi:membrane associated rhomboid family serine protease
MVSKKKSKKQKKERVGFIRAHWGKTIIIPLIVVFACVGWVYNDFLDILFNKRLVGAGTSGMIAGVIGYIFIRWSEKWKDKLNPEDISLFVTMLSLAIALIALYAMIPK